MYSVGTSPPHPSNTTSAFSLGQLDVVHSAGLADTVGDHLQAMFPDELSSRQGSSAPWDTDGSYRASRLRCYLRSHAAPPISSLQEWVSLYIYIYIYIYEPSTNAKSLAFPCLALRTVVTLSYLLSPLSSSPLHCRLIIASHLFMHVLTPPFPPLGLLVRPTAVVLYYIILHNVLLRFIMID
jgi:hypothetical protein